MLVPIHGEDTLVWTLTKNCIFSCKSSWEALRNRSNEVDWDKVGWDAAIMPKHAFIFWLAIQDRLFTFDRLEVGLARKFVVLILQKQV